MGLIKTKNQQDIENRLYRMEILNNSTTGAIAEINTSLRAIVMSMDQQARQKQQSEQRFGDIEGPTKEDPFKDAAEEMSRATPGARTSTAYGPKDEVLNKMALDTELNRRLKAELERDLRKNAPDRATIDAVNALADELRAVKGILIEIRDELRKEPLTQPPVVPQVTFDLSPVPTCTDTKDE